MTVAAAAGLPAYMLDSNVFSRVIDGVIQIPASAGRRLLVTGVQADECQRTPCPVRRAALLRAVEEMAPELCAASSFCVGIEGAGADQAEINDGTGRFDAMLARLKVLGRKPPNQDLNQLRDIVITETALKLDATLVSDDAALRGVVVEYSGAAVPSASLG